jgi:hypothetical protein
MRELYGTVNGADLFQGDARTLPLLPQADDDVQSLVTHSGFLRGANWPLPPELVAFGSDGTGEVFAVWLPEDGAGAPIVVQMGSIFEEASFGVVGDDVVSFLTGWCSWYAMSYVEDGLEQILDVLAVPSSLRVDPDDELEDEHMLELLRWASPRVASRVTDPYEEALTADEVRAVALEVEGR